MNDREWMDDARCIGTDPDAFFPDQGQPAHGAFRVCNVCPVAAECLAYALKHGIVDGVWGNRSGRQRIGLIRATR